MLPPMKPSMAGSRVSAASMVMTTPAAAAIPRERLTSRPTTSRPRTETTTVVPANSTARPAVSMAVTTASTGSCPAASASRYRVTTNRA